MKKSSIGDLLGAPQKSTPSAPTHQLDLSTIDIEDLIDDFGDGSKSFGDCLRYRDLALNCEWSVKNGWSIHNGGWNREC